MKCTLPLAIALLGVQATSVLSAAAPITSASCGDLGVMSIPKDPNTDPTTYRQCAEHPLRRRPNPRSSSVDAESAVRIASMKASLTLANDANGSENQKCYYAAPYGCDSNYCWKACGKEGKGEWCWVAQKDGNGPWTGCRSWEDCKPSETKGHGCGKGCVGACGCGC
ncbi:uncharacterized protein DSM5745_09896 [Aspergillus mulundensis]|uniref:IDI-2 n=1 Tax=Aspergillus mulundensis TaxID=1810919 RepID=A0A3D8QRR4_9EURO|nr:hypothetical protein DSM5745_09896 [Aspergillus mulundensis]RDW64485.1 hypothetical protein DSM5745_09896 [Aspergillus mulundensis]